MWCAGVYNCYVLLVTDLHFTTIVRAIVLHCVLLFLAACFCFDYYILRHKYAGWMLIDNCTKQKINLFSVLLFIRMGPFVYFRSFGVGDILRESWWNVVFLHSTLLILVVVI